MFEPIECKPINHTLHAELFGWMPARNCIFLYQQKWPKLCFMDAPEIAKILAEMGTLLELRGENAFRCNAYHNAARALEQLSGNFAELVEQHRLDEVPGIGKTLQDKITTLARTDHLQEYEDLKASIPPGLVQMLRIPGMGPKKVKALFDTLHIDTLDKLRTACEQNKVAELKGFGKKTQQKILDGLSFIETVGQRQLIADAEAMGQQLAQAFTGHAEVKRLSLCGSLRRRKETIGDLDLLISSNQPASLFKLFTEHPRVVKVLALGDTRASVVLQNGLQADLRVVNDEQFPFALHYFTGSKAHNIQMRARAQTYGLKLNEYGLVGEGRSIACKDEADIFKALELDPIPPELREGTGELEAAEQHALPQLITYEDIKGVLHCHSNWSDGSDPLEAMVRGAMAMGWHYFGIGDHSQSLKVANGLSPERVQQQWQVIDELNKEMKPFRILKGTECDILPDGSLDFDDELLARFDYVVASVHTHMNQKKEEMTQRIIKAVQHPQVTILGHPTGRLLLRRDSYSLDMDAVIKAAVDHQTLLEINAHPARLDLDWLHVKKAKQLGARFIINPDAHAVVELGLTRFGIDVARRGWLERSDVANTQSLKQLLACLKKGNGKWWW